MIPLLLPRLLVACAIVLLSGEIMFAQPAAEPTAAPTNREAEILKAQVTEMKRSEDRLLTTVFWTLSTCGAIVAVLVGFSWFVNFKVYERDKETLRQELRSRLEKDSAAMNAEIQSSMAALVEEKLEELEEKLSKVELRLHRGTLMTMYWDLNRGAKQLIEMGKPEMALESYSVMLGYAKTIGEDAIPRTLDRIYEVLKNDIALSAELVSNFTEVLKGLPDEFSTDRDALTSRIRALRSKA